MNKTKIHFWSADQAGCAYYRCHWVSDALRKNYGDRLQVSVDTVMTKEMREEADVIVGQRVILEGPSHFWQLWSRDRDKVLVMELDDDLFSVAPSNAKASKVFNNPTHKNRLTKNILASDYVTVSTEPLRQAVHKNTGFPLERIVVVPNAVPKEFLVDSVDPDRYTDTVGYLSSPTHRDDFDMVKRHLKRFLGNNPETSFRTVGSDYSTELQMPNQTRHVSWIRPPDRAIRSIDYRISICPLLPGVFNQSKSSCKFLEASARGVVSVVSDVTPYSEVVNGETGYKVRREHEWGRTLQKVYENPQDALRVARNALGYVRDNRTTDHTAPLWFDVLTRGKAT